MLERKAVKWRYIGIHKTIIQNLNNNLQINHSKQKGAEGVIAIMNPRPLSNKKEITNINNE